MTGDRRARSCRPHFSNARPRSLRKHGGWRTNRTNPVASKFFDKSDQTITFEGGWDVSPDGQRVLLMKREAQTETPKLDMVLNWLEELKQRVPVK